MRRAQVFFTSDGQQKKIPVVKQVCSPARAPMPFPQEIRKVLNGVQVISGMSGCCQLYQLLPQRWQLQH